MIRRRLIYLIIMVSGFCSMAVADTIMTVNCGTWLEIAPGPNPDDYHFYGWSDGSSDSVRQVEIVSDTTILALFEANCLEYANWPVVALYDWLFMLNVKAIEQMGYYVAPENVTWYQVVDSPDDMHNRFPFNDRFMGKGYYLTIDQSFVGTGDYYAVVDVSSNQGMLCDGLMRSIIIRYSTQETHCEVAVYPTGAPRNHPLRIVGLNPQEETELRVYDAAGRLLGEYTSRNAREFRLMAASVAGVYQIFVRSKSVCTTLQYIVYD